MLGKTGKRLTCQSDLGYNVITLSISAEHKKFKGLGDGHIYLLYNPSPDGFELLVTSIGFLFWIGDCSLFTE